MTAHRFNAILLAGQRPGTDPLAAHFGQRWKALVEVAGEPMLSRVARTLASRPEIDRIVVVAQQPDALLQAPGAEWMADEPRIETQPGTASICQSILDVLATRPDGYPWLVTTADNVLLSPATVDAFVAGAAGADLAAGVVERRILLAAYPQSRRTWLRFRGGAYSGANLFWLGGPAALRGLAAWARVEQARKRAQAVLAAFGWTIPALAAVRAITIHDAARLVGRRLRLRAAVVALPDPEACMDVDTPADHALAERNLAGAP